MKTSEVNKDISECWASGLHPCEACCLLKIHIDEILASYKAWDDSIREYEENNKTKV